MTTSLFKEYKFQYQFPQYQWISYEDRAFDTTLYEKDGPIARLTFNRPEKRNAFNDRQFLDLLAGLHRAADDPEVRVVIIRGRGPAFSAGHDLSSPEGDETIPIDPKYAPSVRDYFNVERRRCGKHEDILHYPKITIAQVHGYCIGAGEGIQASCDFTIAAEDSIFGVRGFGRITLGLSFWNGSWPGGSHRARTASAIPEMSGKDAAERGLVTRAVPGDRLEEETERFARHLARMPWNTLSLLKESVNGALDVTGMGVAWRAHYAGHISYQYVRFRPWELNFYKTRREKGLKGFIDTRYQLTSASDKDKPSAEK